MKMSKDKDWGLSEEMNALLNGIDITSEKRVIMTAGNKQYMYDNGQIYYTNSKTYSEGKPITREEFRNQAEEIRINYLCNKRNDTIIE